MPFVVVGGVTIPVAPGGVSRIRDDLVDRARALDGTYRASQTGTPKRNFIFETPPVSRADADVYDALLSNVFAQTCSGDAIGGGANALQWSEDFSNAAWTKTTMTVGTGIADPLGGNGGNTLTATGASAQVIQGAAAGSSTVRYGAVWLRRRTGSGTINIRTPDNASWTPVTLTTSYQRFSTVGAASVNKYGGIQIVTSGDAIDAFGYQVGDGTVVQQYAKTTTVAVNNQNPSCCATVTGWTPIKSQDGHRVVLTFELHEV